MNCTHYECRCARANELAVMAARTNRTELLVEALAVHEREVECQLPERVNVEGGK